MPIEVNQRRVEARDALQMVGERDECGLSENIYRFEACLGGKGDQPDLSTIHGLLIHHDGPGDFWVKLTSSSEESIRYKSVNVFQGPTASAMIEQGADVRLQVRSRDILFLHSPTVLDINAQREPGTRLISALQKHYSGRNLEVILDLGIDDESEDFEEYFFPDLDILGMHSHASGQNRHLKYGRWGTFTSEGEPFTVGVAY
jgi:hypothetical protein